MVKSVQIQDSYSNQQKQEEKSLLASSKTPGNAPTFRIISASYEHNLLCLSLTLFKGKSGESSEVFTPIFHFEAHTQSIRCLASSKRYLVSGSNDEHIRIYDLQKRKELGTLLHHSGSITCLEFFQSKWLLSGASDGKLCIWRTKDWEVLAEMKGHSGDINDVSIHPTGRLALSAGADKTLRLWNMMTAKKASVLKLRMQPMKVRWSPEGTEFVVGFDRSISIYSADNSEVVHEIKLNSPLQHMDIIKLSGKDYLVTSHSNGKTIIQEFLLDDSKEPETFELGGHSSRVKHFSFYNENNTDYMTTVSSDGKMVVHDLNKRDQVAVYDTGDRLNVCLMVPEDVENASSMKKRKTDDAEMSAEDTDYSGGESEVEETKPKKGNKKSKSKKAKITVEMES